VALLNAIQVSRTIDVIIATPGKLVDVLTYYENDISRSADVALGRRLLNALDTRDKIDSSLSL